MLLNIVILIVNISIAYSSAGSISFIHLRKLEL